MTSAMTRMPEHCHACGADRLVPLTLRNAEGKTKCVAQCPRCGHCSSTDHPPRVGVAGGSYGMQDGLPPRSERDMVLAAYLYYALLVRPGESILDFGAGWGGLSIELSKLNRKYAFDCSLTCLEVYQNMRDYISQASEGDIRVEAEMETLAEERYDCIICKEVVEHLDDPTAVLRLLRSMAKPGARMFLTTPGNPFSEPQRMSSYYNYYVHGHVEFFNKRSLTALLERCGFGQAYFTYLDDFYPECAKSRDLTEKEDRTFKNISKRHHGDPHHLQVVCLAV